MKRCPECRRDYTDRSLVYCLDDGALLVDGPGIGSETPTAIVAPTDPEAVGVITGTEDRTAMLNLHHGLSSQNLPIPERFLTKHRWFIIFGLVVLTAAFTGTYLYRKSTVKASEPKQFEISEAREGGLSRDSAPALLLSPDGRRLVATFSLSGSTQLFQRLVSESDWQPIAGTEGARDPFFSPDGNSLGFFARGELKSVPLTGGSTTLHAAPNARGGVWESNESVIFTPGTDSPLYRISSKGGEAVEVSTIDPAAKERSHRWPDMLPGGKALVFSIVYQTGNPLDNADVAVLDLKTGKHKVLFRGGSFPRYSPTGHIIYATSKSLFAVPFDIEKMDVTGPAFELIPNVLASATNGRAQYSFSKNGDLVFQQHRDDDKNLDKENGLVLISRSGQERSFPAPSNRYSKPRFADGGKQIYSEIASNQESVWSLNVDRGTLTPLTQAGVSYNPAPNPNGKIVAYEAVRDGVAGVMISNVDGSDERRLSSTKQFQFPSSWSPDGKSLLITAGTDRGFSEIWSINMDSIDTPQVLVSGNFNAAAGRYSPDGKWIAYVSDESGRNEIYVRSTIGEPNKVRISVDGGIQPVWAPNGKELFFRTSHEFYSATFRFTPAIEADKPAVLFTKEFADDSSGPAYETEPDFDVTSDGNSFIIGRRVFESESPRQKVILNWFTVIEQAGDRPK